MTLQPDRDQLEIFVQGLFRHASPQGIVSLRSFSSSVTSAGNRSN
jgi:hypothetical protein